MEERLYAADLDEFVKERTAAAKELRGRGERGEAAAVAKLSKPSVAAWVVNRLARDQAKATAALLDAGARLRDVQLGAGSASDLRAAGEAQESALRALMRAAERIAGGRGSATPATLDRVRETLHAAALDADLAGQVRRGVLVREQRAVGFPMGLAIPEERRRPAPPTPKLKPKAASARKAAAPEKRRDEVGEKRRERAAAAAQKAADALAAAEEALAEAQEELAEAEARAKDARRLAERAEKAHAKAANDAEQALERLRDLER
ncbi:MAG TPA: hypothetical protein VFI18_08145 [Gaiellales bacterium]|nr:hypothetical protein [Gaiellales bacterium]